MSFSYFNGEVILNGKVRFKCVSLYTYFGENQLPHAVAIVANSNDENYHKTYFDMYSDLTSMPYGADAVVEFIIAGDTLYRDSNLKPTKMAMFRGKLNGFGNISMNRIPHLCLWLDHWMVPLTWASSIVNDVHGRSFTDRLLPPTIGDGEGLVPYTPGNYTEQDVKTDLWANVIKPELINLASMSTIGYQNNSDALEILEDPNKLRYDGSERPLTLDSQNYKEIIADIRRTIYSVDKDESTIWSKLTRLAVRYKFSVIPRINDYSIAPVTPCLSKNAIGKVLLLANFSNMSDQNMRERFMTNAEVFSEGFSSFSYPFDFSSRVQRGDSNTVFLSDTIANENVRRIKRVAQPPWLYPSITDSFSAAETMGFRAGKELLAPGYFNVNPLARDPDTEKTLNEKYNDITSEDTLKYNNADLAEERFRERTIVIRFPIMFDYSPGSSITFEMLGGRVDADKVLHVYCGIVQRVTIAMDQLNNRSHTWIVVSHLRNQQEQLSLPWTEHPLYNQRWARAPLLRVNGLTLAPETGPIA